MDPASHSDHNKPETTIWTPQNDFERTHETAIRERLRGGFLLPSQAIQAVRNQIDQDNATRPDSQSISGNLGAPFTPGDDWEKKHVEEIRERMRCGISRAQAIQCVKDQHAQDAK